VMVQSKAGESVIHTVEPDSLSTGEAYRSPTPTSPTMREGPEAGEEEREMHSASLPVA